MISFKDLGKMGRLGNRLFQVAATIALAIRNDDTYVFPRWTYENNFNLHNCFSDQINNSETYKETGFTYSPIPYKPNLNLFGFFQSEKYFADCQDIIQNLLTPTIGFGIKYDHTAIHVRRGDYINLTKEYTLLEMSYYQEAMKITNSQKYIVFSDDIWWCKNNFKGDNFIFSEGKSVIEDLALFLACENSIIANSSFSWWGAYLNKNPSKIVVSPKKWFGPAQPYNMKDLIPDEWVKI
jgi:hypothetical protein